MTCSHCWAIDGPRPKRSYLVELIDAKSNRGGSCVVQSECDHDMQEWITHLARQGALMVCSPDGEKFRMDNPVVVNIDAEKAAHVPIVDPVN
jgi:hypothetical protein